MSCHAVPGRMLNKKILNLSDCIPVLYFTPTILSASIRSHSKQFRQPTPRLEKGLEFSKQRRCYNTNATTKYDIPFENTPFGSEETSAHEEIPLNEDPQAPGRSTLTPSERLAFHRIAKESRNAARKINDNDGDLEQVATRSDILSDDLNSIFDAAIQDQSKEIIDQNPDKSPRLPKALDDFHEDGQSPASPDFRGIIRPGKFRNIARATKEKEDDERLLAATEKYRSLLEARMESAATDSGVWAVLESELFNLVKRLCDHMGREEKARKTTSSKASDRRVKAPGNTIALEQTQGSAVSEAFAPWIDRSGAISAQKLNTIVQESYTSLNVEALRIWRHKFRASPYSLQLLPEIKSMGSVSYVLGASTSLYNELLFVKWSQQQDLYGIADLLQEMLNQGIQFNNLTIEFLHYLGRLRLRDREGSRGRVLQMWWNLRGVKDGWSRIKHLYEEVRRELGRFRARSSEGPVSDADIEESFDQEQVSTEREGSKTGQDGFRMTFVRSDRQAPRYRDRM